MAGLRRICKLYGGMKCKGADGKTVEWVWDYVRDEPRLKSDMDKEARAAILGRREGRGDRQNLPHPARSADEHHGVGRQGEPGVRLVLSPAGRTGLWRLHVGAEDGARTV
jgi:hypothetical protein